MARMESQVKLNLRQQGAKSMSHAKALSKVRQAKATKGELLGTGQQKNYSSVPQPANNVGIRSQLPGKKRQQPKDLELTRSKGQNTKNPHIDGPAQPAK